MPTARTRTFLFAVLIFYLFANQTQVGWLYVMMAALAGIVLAGAVISRGVLRGLGIERTLAGGDEAERFEGEELPITLKLWKDHGVSAAHLRVHEHCPLAAPESTQRDLAMFIPSLPTGAATQFSYTAMLDRRGVYHFPPLNLRSAAPFGLFKHQRQIAVETNVLVYPEVRQLTGLDLLDRQLSPQLTRPRAGVGYEVMGVRPYRTGDSPRHIHWRSVARTNQLISKEFADEAQPGLSLILDLQQRPFPDDGTKHNPFEWAVKCAASIADYAMRKGYPLHLIADEEVLAVPTGPVNRYALLNYLARVQPTGTRGLNNVIGRQPAQAFVAVILPFPDRAAVEPLLALRQRCELLVVVLDPPTFPAAQDQTAQSAAAPLVDELRALAIDARQVRFADDWADQLAGMGMPIREMATP